MRQISSLFTAAAAAAVVAALLGACATAPSAPAAADPEHRVVAPASTGTAVATPDPVDPVPPPAPPAPPVADAASTASVPSAAPATAAEPALATPAPAPMPQPQPQPQPQPPAASGAADSAATAPARPARPAPAPAAALSLSGQLVLSAGPGQRVGAGELAQSAVYFRPDNAPSRPAPGRYRIETRNSTFRPATLIVPVGSTVAFPNLDPILHNVFSLTPGSTFDLGFYGEGETGSATLQRPGVVTVYCNVHYGMFANIVVVDTPHFVAIDDRGTFRLDQLPAGAGTLHVWHPRTEPFAQRVELPHGQALSVRLTATRPLIPEHTNKEGESYRKARP